MSKETTETATTLRRDDYKNIKHMNRETLEKYLQGIYRQGVEAGIKASQKMPPGIVPKGK
ncbi:MAG: hypothetical protein LBK57_03715 [Clostridiales Family XIII bacterium]|jgi:hypothetical protein|nr:hypothetical protein [Clostridiales Family XIII bacterium]